MPLRRRAPHVGARRVPLHELNARVAVRFVDIPFAADRNRLAVAGVERPSPFVAMIAVLLEITHVPSPPSMLVLQRNCKCAAKKTHKSVVCPSTSSCER